MYKNNIIYILESPGNGNADNEFFQKYYNEKKDEVQERPKESPYNSIYPLFNVTDPLYMKELTGYKNKEKTYTKVFSDKEIDNLAIKNMITNFKVIIDRIKKK